MVVVSFLFVLATKGRMQPVVLAPKNLKPCIKNYIRFANRDHMRTEQNTKENQYPRGRQQDILSIEGNIYKRRRTQARILCEGGGEAVVLATSGKVNPGG